MKKQIPLTCFTFLNLVLFLFGWSSTANAQCSLTCNINVQVALGPDCSATVEPDDILEGSYDAACFPFSVNIPAVGSNVVTGANLGQTLNAIVTSADGNNCMGSISIVDKINPVIQCQPATITCFDDPNTVAAPTATDNCDGNVSVTLTSENTQSIGCSGNSYEIITRTYTATDDSGNSSSCDQIITVTRPSLNQVAFPMNYDDLALPSLDCVNPNTSPANTGEPTINGFSIDNVCNYGVDFQDQVIPICENSYKILREWTVHDWCTSLSQTHTQIIKVVDDTPPTINCQSTLTISTEQNSCYASFFIPDPNISDDCSSNNNIDISVQVSAGNVQGNVVFQMPLGTHTITYTATDDCGNSATCVTQVEIVDQVAPVAVCETNHVVALNSPAGATLVEAIVFDDGSEDNCSDLIYEVRRMDAPHCPGFDGTSFSQFAPFYCCDVGNSVMVELRVTDAAGNSNSCMVEATVQDQLNPIISCPANVTIDCNEDPNDLSVTGEPVVTDNCNATVTYVDNGGADNCGNGQINRIWTATDDSGNTASCVQIITFENSTPFFITDTECNNPNPNDGVIWPCDYDTDACGPGLDPSITGEPQIFEDFCDLVAVTYEDVYLPITAPACVKVLRTWLVVDWCQYDENTEEGSWTYTQVIKVLNSDDPIISSDCTDLEFCSYDENCEDGDATLILDASDDCSDAADLNYDYVIDAFNDGSDDIFGSTNDASGTYPLGTHKITWTVEDGCGNISTCDYLFTIKDCKKPTPYAYNGLAIELMPQTCMVELWAVDFDAGSFDNCGIEEFRIATPSQGPGQTTPPPFPSSAVTFTGDDVGTNTVDLWVKDVNDNWDYVSTYVIVQDNQNCSSAPPSVQGNISTEYDDPVADVNIDLSITGIPNLGTSTDADGNYVVSLPGSINNFVITPEKDINHTNGVSTLDVIQIARHILNIQPLDSPYKLIAADANNSGSITTLDAVAIRKLILGIENEFPNNTSWRFVDAEFIFPDPNNPFMTSFPEIYSVNGVEGEVVFVDFVGVKVGDVTESADGANLDGGEGDTRSGDLWNLKIEDQQLVAGETYTVSFQNAEEANMVGYQFTIDFNTDALAFNSLVTGAEEHFNTTQANRGLITTSWHKATAQKLAVDHTLFELQFTAKTNTQLSDVLRINSRMTKAEAYDSALATQGVELSFTSEQVRFTLQQNLPNPFKEGTTIGYMMPSAGPATLTIHDSAGNLVHQVEQQAAQGYNEFVILDSDLKAEGVFYYQLDTSEGSITKKMVHIK